MRALVVYESMYGNTAAVAERIRDGLAESWEVDLCGVDEHPPLDLSQYGLVVVGGPTHAFGMSTAPSREEAVKNAAASTASRIGVREWLPRLAGAYDGQIAVFDTRMGRYAGSAAKAITRYLRRAGRRPLARRSFRVAGQRGPLREGEAYQARTWGSELAVLARAGRTTPSGPA